MTSLPEALSRQVERVTILRERYHAASMASRNRNLFPALCLMNAAIEAAHQAAGAGDAQEQMKVLKTLEGFSE